MPRVCVIGLDALAPSLVFERFRGQLPHLEALAASGIAAPLESSVPPITVPAWAAMVTGVDPGALGLYGFKQRLTPSYEPGALASSLSHNVSPLWTLASRAGMRVRVLGVPLTYPPKPVRGALVSGPLTPNTEARFTHPPELAAEVQALTGGYVFDLPNFRTTPADELLAAIYDMSERRMRLARDWVARDDWDFFMLVEMGSDRVQHGFWGYGEPSHPSYDPEGPFVGVVEDYYRWLDARVGELVALLRPDDVVLVVSDHGAQPMRGGLALNQWLIERGDLVLAPEHPESGPLQVAAVDWQRTRAWAEGGYVGRIHLNLRGRQPQGTLGPDEALELLDELEAELVQLRGPDGEALHNSVHRPPRVYREVRGVAPDLMVYIDELAYRALGSVGHSSWWTRGNDSGVDHANHSRHGVLIMRDGAGPREVSFAPTLYDVAPTVLGQLGLGVPEYMLGRVIRSNPATMQR